MIQSQHYHISALILLVRTQHSAQFLHSSSALCHSLRKQRVLLNSTSAQSWGAHCSAITQQDIEQDSEQRCALWHGTCNTPLTIFCITSKTQSLYTSILVTKSCLIAVTYCKRFVKAGGNYPLAFLFITNGSFLADAYRPGYT